MPRFLFIFCAFIFAAVVALVGANFFGNAFPSAATPETEDKNFILGKKLMREENYTAAMEAFYKVVNAHEDAPEAHFDLGQIALKKNMPLDAIFHFRQYARQVEDPRKTKEKDIEGLCAAAREKYLAQLPGKPFATDVVAPDFEKKYKQVMQENDRLKRELSGANRQIKDLQKRLASPVTPPEPGTRVAAKTPEKRTETPRPDVPGRTAVPATHIIQPGDTLTKISKKYYGTQNRWKEIYNYNRDVMRSPSELKVGSSIKLPPQ